VLPTITVLKKKLVKIDAKHVKPLCDALSNNFLFATTRAYLHALQWRELFSSASLVLTKTAKINLMTKCLKNWQSGMLISIIGD